MGRAAALVGDGCYQCLREALTIYEGLLASPRPDPAITRHTFETTLLIVLREKELGLPWDASLARARELGRALDEHLATSRVPSASSVSSVTLLDAAAFVRGELTGLDPEQRLKLPAGGRGLAPDNPQRRALDPFVTSNLTAAYLALAIDCEQAALRDGAKPDEIRARFSAPLVRFRAGLCYRPPDDLAPLRNVNPRWTDTLLFEARRELAGGPDRAIDVYRAGELLGQAREAFPSSHAITMSWANAEMLLADFDRALEGFDRVLDDVPTHRDALLGRLTTLSYLFRHGEAIMTATRILELGTWYVGDAYYWRAWNRYNLRSFDPAWNDVEEATKLLSNTSVYALAGLIAYGRGERSTAIERFDRALQIDGSNCDAAWMAALVHTELDQWPLGTPKFSRAMTCYISAVSAARADLAALEASKRPEAQKVRQRQKLQQTIDESEQRAAQSAFNAAQGYARQGQRSLALNHVGVAAAYAPLSEKAASLKAAIEKLPDLR